MSVEEYTREFEKLLIRCDLQEAKEQTIVRYLGGLDPKYAHVVESNLIPLLMRYVSRLTRWKLK